MATWYLDNTASGANNGTSWTNAWESLSAIPTSGTISAGDTIYISGGSSGQTYTGATQFPHVTGGVSGNPITFAVGQDASHNGMVTFDGGGSNNQFIFAAASQPISWITINGNVNGAAHFRIRGWNGATDLDNGATGLVFRYVISDGTGPDVHGVGHGNCQFRGYNCTHMEFDHCQIGPCVNVNRNILGIGANANLTTYTNNLIHDCLIQAYYIHGNNGVGGNGDDFCGDIAGVHLYHNNFIGIWLGNLNIFASDQSAQFTINQHQDGIQTGYDYVFVDSNYFEDIANYCVFVDYETSGGEHWIIINNVMNYGDSTLTGQPTQGVGWGSHLSGATLSTMLFANNTIFGGGEGISDNLTTNLYSGIIIANNLCYNQNGLGINTGGTTTGVTCYCNKAPGGIVPSNTTAPANNVTPTWQDAPTGATPTNPATSYPNMYYGSLNAQLSPSDTGAGANGTNSWATGGTSFDGVLVNYDAVGTTRPSNGQWALGAFEPGTTPPPPPVAGSGLTAASDFSLAKYVIGVSGGYSPPTNNYVALYSSQFTSTAKAGATEWTSASDGSYVRQAMGANGAGWTISAYVSGTGVSWNNTNLINFSSVTLNAQTLYSIACCDALSSGNINFFVDISTAITVPVGFSVQLPATTGLVFTAY